MRLDILLLVVIASGLFAAIWAFLVGLVWLIVAAFARQMSRYWPVVLGTLRGAFLLGSLVGILKHPSDLEGVLEISGTYCLIGAVGGALWGYYGLTQRLRSLISDTSTSKPVPTPPVRQPRRAIQPRPVARRPVTPSQPPANFQPKQLSTHPSEQPPEQLSEPSGAEHQPVVGSVSRPPASRTQQGDSQAIADLLCRQLQPQGITVQVKRQGHKLRIGLRREAILEAKPTVSSLQQSLGSLKPQGIQQVEVISQSGANAAHVWRRSFSLLSDSISDVPISNSPKLRSKPLSMAYQPPRNPSKFVIEVSAQRYEVPAIIVWAIAGGFFFLDILGAMTNGIMLLWLMLRLSLALIPALIAQQRGRPFLPWFLYGYIYFLVALVFAILIKQREIPDFSHQDLRQVSFARQSLQQANFQGANVSGVDFSQTDLSAANFKQADCTGACFNQASIRGTCFNQAILNQATFVRARQGKAAISINKIFSSIPPILWGFLVVMLTVVSLMGLLTLAIGPQFRILLMIVLGYGVMSFGITWSLINLIHTNREAAPLVLGFGVGLAIMVQLSADELTPIVPGLGVITLFLAAIAQCLLHSNRWSQFGAAIGALGTLCFTEAWVVFFKVYAMPVGTRWVFAVVSAITGCLLGAFIQQGLTSFRAAHLTNADFTTADLQLADFRDADIQQATFNRAQMKGVFLPTGRRQQLATVAIRLSEQMTAYLQRFRT